MKNLLIFLLIFIGVQIAPAQEDAQLDSILATTKNKKIKAFFENYWYAAKLIQHDYKIPAGLILAQMAFESDWCQYKPAKERKNFLGIMHQGKLCWFKSVEDCLDVYRRILNQKCYQSIKPKSFDEWLDSLDMCNYAGNEEYSVFLLPFIEKYNLRWL